MKAKTLVLVAVLAMAAMCVAAQFEAKSFDPDEKKPNGGGRLFQFLFFLPFFFLLS